MISVIIPIYNSSNYLPTCIQSVLNQSFNDFELLLINDGSTDNSIKISEEFAQKDQRIKLFSQKNGGQGSARNVGLKNANGNYIMFVDSDDAIASDTLLSNYEILKQNPTVDCLQFPIYRNYGSKDSFKDIGVESLYGNELDFKKLLLEKSVISWIVCDKIIKREVLKNLYFPEDIIYEDNYFMLDLIERLNCVYISEKGMYYYYQRENSTTTSEFSLKSEQSTSRVLMKVLDEIKLPEEKSLFLKYLIRLINVDKSLRVNFNHYLKEVKNYKTNLSLNLLLSNNLSFKNRVKLLGYKFLR